MRQSVLRVLAEWKIVLVLCGIWLVSAWIYYSDLVRPYELAAFVSIPNLSLGLIAGRRLGPAVNFVLSFLLLFSLYALAYDCCKKMQSTLAALGITSSGVALALLLMRVYPVGALDVIRYIGSGELLALYGLNPMVHTPSEIANLPLKSQMIYVNKVSNYGPLWSWIEAGVVKAGGQTDLLSLVIGFKGVAIFAYLAACLLIIAILRRRAPQLLVSGVIAFAWNPLVLYEVAVNAHNDIWVGVFILVGILFWEMRRPFLMLVGLTMAVLVKLPVVFLLPLFGLAAWRLALPHDRRRLFIWGVTLVVAIVIGSYLSMPEGLAGMGNLQRRNDWFTDSLPAVVKLSLQLRLPENSASLISGGFFACVFSAYFLLQLRQVYRNPKDPLRPAFNTLLFLLLVCITWFEPWYLLWVLTLAAIYPRPNAPFQVALSSLCVTWTYIVFGFIWFWYPNFGNWGKFLGIESLALMTTYALPWAYAMLYTWRQSRAARLTHEQQVRWAT